MKKMGVKNELGDRGGDEADVGPVLERRLTIGGGRKRGSDAGNCGKGSVILK